MLDWLQREGQRVMWAVGVGALVGGLNAHAHHVGSIGFGLWLLLGGCVGWILINPAAVMRNIAAAWRLAMTSVPKAKITSVVDGSAVRRFIKEFCFVMLESLRCAWLEFVSVISLWLASSSWILLACFFLGAKPSVYEYVLRMMVGVGMALATTMSLLALVYVTYHEDMLPAAKRINPLAVLLYYIPFKLVPWIVLKAVPRLFWSVVLALVGLIYLVALCHSTARATAFCWAAIGALVVATVNPIAGAVGGALMGRLTYELITVRLFNVNQDRITSFS